MTISIRAEYLYALLQTAEKIHEVRAPSRSGGGRGGLKHDAGNEQMLSPVRELSLESLLKPTATSLLKHTSGANRMMPLIVESDIVGHSFAMWIWSQD